VKQHTEDRDTGKSLCGREMPADHDAWDPDRESCQACADVAERRRATPTHFIVHNERKI
jgi:hypothetical protein